MTADPKYAAAWRAYRAWSWLFGAGVLLWLPVAAWTRSAAIAIAWMLAVAALAFFKGRFSCPRCGGGFFTETTWTRGGPLTYWRPWARRCRQCALPKWAGAADAQYVRACEPSDFAAMVAVINDAAQAYRGVIAGDRWKEPYMPADELRDEFGRGVRFWGAFDGGQLLGVMGLQHVKDVALIRHAYTRTTAQGRGVGTTLLERLRGDAGRRPLLVGTWKAATWAIRFYERHGFQLVDDAEKERLLRSYWTVPDRQIEESVVLRSVGAQQP